MRASIFDGMPKSAISTGLADFVLTPDRLAAQLLGFARHPYVTMSQREEGTLGEENDLNRIFACWYPRNPASGRVLEKIGMVDEGTSREHFEKDGELLDMRHAAILRREHDARR